MPVNCKFNVKSAGLIALIALFSFRHADETLYEWPQSFLTGHFDADAEALKVKKFDLQVTPDGFFRLKKTFQNSKQEYFSFNLKKLDDVDFLGSTSSGMLLLKTSRPDIIVQTYNDRKGDIDSMSAVLQLPLKSIEPEGLDSLVTMLKKIKGD